MYFNIFKICVVIFLIFRVFSLELGVVLLKIVVLVIKYFGCIDFFKECIVIGYYVIVCFYIYKYFLKFVLL